MIDTVKLDIFFKKKKQKTHYLVGTKLERSDRNLSGISGTNWNSEQDKTCSNLFCFFLTKIRYTGNSKRTEQN
jgi:hypothetical protein